MFRARQILEEIEKEMSLRSLRRRIETLEMKVGLREVGCYTTHPKYVDEWIGSFLERIGKVPVRFTRKDWIEVRECTWDEFPQLGPWNKSIKKIPIIASPFQEAINTYIITLLNSSNHNEFVKYPYKLAGSWQEESLFHYRAYLGRRFQYGRTKWQIRDFGSKRVLVENLPNPHNTKYPTVLLAKKLASSRRKPVVLELMLKQPLVDSSHWIFTRAKESVRQPQWTPELAYVGDRVGEETLKIGTLLFEPESWKTPADALKWFKSRNKTT